MNTSFEWDEDKNAENVKKHGVNFETAQYAFADLNQVIAEDLGHSQKEKRFYCFGKVKGGVITVRFTYRENRIRIIGAGYWRKGKKIYEEKNRIHR
ncbi:MAG: BrnT family toxin [Candidatus Blackburnbacteria bacterium]|nr:BrnT family toxin [Candidatus Blackburnbacteria bacterium]